jgi:hypothetical protein
VSCLAVSHHARRNRRLTAIARDWDAVLLVRVSLSETTAADLGIPARPLARTTMAADSADRVCGHHASCAEAARLPSGKIVVQLHDIK